MISDPTSDLLTKLRNGSRAKHATVDARASKFSERILALLKQEGFIRAYKAVGEGTHKSFRIYLKYAPGRVPVIKQLVRASKPGRRQYRKATKLPRVLGGLGRAILTTSKGVMTDQEARRQRLGGEVVCYVW